VIESLKYPALVFSRGMVFPARSADDLSLANRAALKNGYFSGQLIVDSTGKAVKIKDAKKLHGVGPFFGYNIFLNQRIKVELLPDGQPSQKDVGDVRDLVLKALRGNQGWNASGDYDELVASAERAKSISEIAGLIADAYHRTYRVR